MADNMSSEAGIEKVPYVGKMNNPSPSWPEGVTRGGGTANNVPVTSETGIVKDSVGGRFKAGPNRFPAGDGSEDATHQPNWDQVKAPMAGPKDFAWDAQEMDHYDPKMSMPAGPSHYPMDAVNNNELMPPQAETGPSTKGPADGPSTKVANDGSGGSGWFSRHGG